jgi:hypothetical protein
VPGGFQTSAKPASGNSHNVCTVSAVAAFNASSTSLEDEASITATVSPDTSLKEGSSSMVSWIVAPPRCTLTAPALM